MGKAPILIADPDARVASLAAHALRREGMEALVAHRGEDALAMLASAPSLVFCEVSLPGIDGFALCENARKEPLTREVPFFLLTRRHDKAEREHAVAVQADDLLAKPLYARDMISLARLFSGRPKSESRLEGDLKELPFFYLLRALTSGMKSGEVQAEHENASVHFRDGRVVEAACGELTGEAALTRLLVLSEGQFTVRLAPVLLRGTLSYSLRDLVTHDEPRRRRFDKAVALMGGPETKLVIDFAALTRELPRLPPSVEKVVRLFDGTRTLGEALRASDLEEVTSAEAVLRLRMAGILTTPPEAGVPRGEVKLFEPRNDEALLEMRKLFPEGAAPAPVEAEGAPKEIRDWMDEIGHRTAYQEMVAVKDGGWVAQAATEAGRQLREIGGAEADADIEKQIAVLDGPAAQRPAAPEEPPIPASELERAPELPASYDENDFFDAPAMGNAATRKLVSILIVAGCIALGIGAVIAIKYAQQHRAQAVAVQAMPAPEVVAPQPPPSVPSPTPPSEPTPSPAVTPEPVKQAQPGVPTPVPEVKNEPAPEPVKSPEPAKPAVDVNALLARGQALFEQGQPEAALKPLEAAAAAAPDNAGVQVVLALARLDAGKTAAAQTAALRAVELAPQNARAHLALGSVLQALEQPAKARAEFETYLRLAPTGKDAADVRAILSSLK